MTNPIWVGGPSEFCGMRVISDVNCMENTTERLFKESRHRSARVHKKLVKRFGGVYRKQPAVFKVGNVIMAHPAVYDEIRRLVRDANTFGQRP